MKAVLFACVHNAGRSQMAAALFNRLADRSKVHAISAGTEPGAGVHPEVIEAMREIGVELSSVRPQRLTDQLADAATMLVTMGCGEACPVVPGVERDDWPLEDPKGKPLARVREIRGEIARRVRALLCAHDWLPWTIRQAQPSDRARVEALLHSAGLPTAGVAEHFDSFVVAVDAGSRVVGSAGLELYGKSALLRSVAVDQSTRTRGLGSMLTQHMLANARSRGMPEVYLLTTTVEGFFEQRGFARIARAQVPQAVAQSGELNGVCPDTATVMRLRW